MSSDAPENLQSSRPTVDSQLVRKTAHLARLEVQEDEIPKLVDHMEKILDLVGELGISAAADQKENSVSVVSDFLNVNEWREDDPAQEDHPGGPRNPDQIGINSPDWRDGTFVTPRVVGGD